MQGRRQTSPQWARSSLISTNGAGSRTYDDFQICDIPRLDKIQNIGLLDSSRTGTINRDRQQV